MPTPEEIKKMAREYALKNCSALVPAGRIDFIINDFIEHLSKDYCIVPKSKVLEEYNYYKNSWTELEPNEDVIESFETLFRQVTI